MLSEDDEEIIEIQQLRKQKVHKMIDILVNIFDIIYSLKFHIIHLSMKILNNCNGGLLDDARVVI